MPSKASRRFENLGNSRANDNILKDKKGELAKMILDKPKSLKKMLEEKQVFATCIWNYMSARAAEKAGFEATLLASGPLSANKIGYNDLGLVTLDEFVWETERITNRSTLPLILDAENGFGDSPLHAHRTCQRLAKAGAQAVQIEDTMGIRGFARLFYENTPDQIIPVEDWLAKLRAQRQHWKARIVC